MPINANIPLGVNPLQLPQQDPNQGMNALARMMQLRGMQDEQQVNALNMQKLQRGVDEESRLNSIYGGAVGPDGTIDRNKLFGGLATGNLGSKIPGIQKQLLEADEARFKMQNEAAKGYDRFRKTVGAHAAQPAPSRDAVAADIQGLVVSGSMDGSVAQRLLSAMPTDPQQLKGYLQQAATSQMDPKDMLTVFAPKPKQIDNGQQISFVDENPLSPTYGKGTGPAPVQKQATPGETLTDQRTRSEGALNRGQTERHFQAGQNAPQYMETDAGLVALPKKLSPGQAPVGTPVMGANGQPLGKPLKDIPPAVNGAIIQNTQSLNQIDRALTLLSGKNIGDPTKGGQAGDASATGMKGYLPQNILNRVDPKGVDARAEVSDIGSLKIHDRSGAAVTISESPRLVPFVPLATDDAVTVKKKLARLRTELVNESNALAETYSKEQGYKPSPVKPKGTGGVTVSNW